LRESATRIREHGLYKTIIIMGDAFTLPPELRTEFVTIEFDIPTTDHLFQMLSKLIDSIREKGSEAYAHIQPSEEVLRAFASACTGLTENEMRSLMSSSIAKFRTLDEQGVQFAQQEKARILLQGGALSIRKPRGGLEIVGGMEGVKGWVNSINNLIKHPAEASAYGLKIPSGLLMVGVSGAGKSLMAEALGGHWQLPVLLFDVGSAYGSLVGESEANIRRMQKMANAMKPCIVYIDEIEKGLGGDGMDGGTSNRCKQSLLTWLNDKDPQIFVVATANDLSKLNQIPELTRAGRFDAQFFVDLPSATARLEIFKIHLRATGHDMPENALTDVVEATHGYSGAEIEAIVQDALREAFNAEPQLDHPTGEMLCECACQRKPLSLVMQETISQLRELVKSGRILPAGSSVEDDLRGRHRKKEEQVLADSQEALPGLLNSLGFETTEEE
jgi:SpoVK/Ycf46/Vps4 family AAA+-type ATPase